MRNLKKFLALVLAMMMTLSLMITVNAATTSDFTDKDSITKEFGEGVEVLKGMGVFEGYEDGTFLPKNSITRAEVATIVYRLATGDAKGDQAHLYKDYQKFDDVKPDHWAAGYINYCANAEWIAGYGNGKFGPNDSVTGYQAAAMILRAVGYGKNGEFQGPTWQVQVANVTRSKDLLTNVDKTTYANTLNNAAPRELVAEILFQAAQIPTVTWTQLNGYNEYPVALPTTGTAKNPSLGLINYGLTNQTGIIVGNQETGERVTILGRAGSQAYISVDGASAGPVTLATWTAYNYPGTSVVDGASVWDAASGAPFGGTGDGDILVNNSLYLNYKSGIDVFAHNVKFWYNGGLSDGTLTGTSDAPRTVYAAIDKVKAEKIVFAGDADLNGTNLVGAANQSLGKMVADSGMVMKTNNQAIFNTAFDRLTLNHHTDTNYGTTGTPSPSSLYKIISNSTNVDGKNVLDVVIELNVQSSKITGVDNVSAFKYVTAETSGTNFLTNTNIKTTTGFIAQAALVGDSVKALSANEIGWHITGTTPQSTVADGGRRNVGSAAGTEGAIIHTLTNAGTADTASKAYFKLGAVATKEGTVTSYHNHTANVPGTGYVTLSDGTRLNQSVLYNTVQANTIPQQSTNATANDQNYGSMTYRFYLDAEGNYIGAEPIVGTEFVYGTYIDFESNLGTSTYTYRLVGVGMDGKMVTKDVSRHSTTTFQSAATSAIGSTGHELDAIGVPFRGDAGMGTSVTGVQPGKYVGFAVNGSGVVNTDIGNTSAANLATPMQTGSAAIFPADITLNSRDAAIGAKLISSTAGAGAERLYVTEATKFILVSGTGTDTQKVAVYNGISELLGSNRQVTFDFTTTMNTAGVPAYFRVNGGAATTYANMAVWSQSDFIYAQDNTGTAKQANVIFLPAEAVDGVGSSLYYVGNSTPLLVNAYGEDATKFAMYVDGERGEYWIEGLVDDTQAAGPTRTSATIVAFGATAGIGTVADNHDQFYNLTDTGKKAIDGQPIYSVTAVTASYDTAVGGTNRAKDGIVIAKDYVAATTDSQTAMIYTTIGATPSAGALYKVTGAKVVNLNKDNKTSATSCVWPNITDLATLNEASSLNNVAAYREVQVSVVLSSDNLTAEVIYVCYNQAHT